MKFSQLYVFALLSFFSAPAFADGITSLQIAVQNKVLSLANDASSDLGKDLRKINEDMTDGRNPDGVFAFPMKAKSLQLVLISGQDGFGQYCNAVEGHPEQYECTNAGDLANYVVVFPYKWGVHKAGELGSATYTVAAESAKTWKTDKNGKVIPGSEKTVVTVPAPKALEIKF